MDPFEKIYTSRDIADALPNLPSEGLMQNWFVRGVIAISDANPGRGKRRLYSFHEALQVAFVTHMTLSSEPTKIAGPVAKTCADFLANWILEGNTLEQLGPDDEFVVLYMVRGLVEDKVRHIDCRVIKRTDFSIYAEYAYFHFRVFDFYGCALQFFEGLESVMHHKRNLPPKRRKP